MDLRKRQKPLTLQDHMTLLKYVRHPSYAEIGRQLGVDRSVARKRIVRSLDKFFKEQKIETASQRAHIELYKKDIEERLISRIHQLAGKMNTGKKKDA